MAVAEAEAVFGVRGMLQGNHLLLDASLNTGLAFTREIHEILQEPSWPDIITGSFCVRGTDAKNLARSIWADLEQAGITPLVDLERPETEIHILGEYTTRLLWRNEEQFSKRRSHLRKHNHPTSLSPKLARAMVNLARGNQLIDPFCGAGGILIEGCLAGKHMTGGDIDPVQIRRAEENLTSLGCNANLMVGDVKHAPGGFDAVVTDLPLGKNAVTTPDFMDSFLARLPSLAPRAIVGATPELAVHFKKWEITRFDLRIHKSLVKTISILSVKV